MTDMLSGFKSIRFMEQQLVMTLPGGGHHVMPGRNYFMEIVFETGAVVNVPLLEKTYRECMARLAEQPGLSMEQRLQATHALEEGKAQAPLQGESLHRGLTPEQLAAAIERVNARRSSSAPQQELKPCHRCGASVSVEKGTDIVTCSICLGKPGLLPPG